MTPKASERVTYKVLTLHQPWASLIALGVKSIETRSWSTHYRGPLAIHAGVKKPRNVWAQEPPDLYDPIAMDRYLEISEDVHGSGSFLYEWRGPLGAIVAACTLVDVVPIVGSPMMSVEKDAADKAGHYLLCAVGGLGREILGLFRASDGMGVCSTNGNAHEHPFSAAYPHGDHSGQKPYGDFTLATKKIPKVRYAWLLADIVPVDPPVPFKGAQGLSKTWTPE